MIHHLPDFPRPIRRTHSANHPASDEPITLIILDLPAEFLRPVSTSEDHNDPFC